MLSLTRHFAPLTIVALTFCVAACGGEGNLGVESEDRAIVGDTLRAQHQVSEAMVNFAQAEGAQDLAGMRKSVDDMAVALDESRSSALEIEDGELRRLISDFASDQSDVVDLFDEYVAYMEDDMSAADTAYEQMLFERISDAGTRAEKSGLTMLNEMLDHATPEQRKVVSAAMKDYEAKIDSAYDSSGE